MVASFRTNDPVRDIASCGGSVTSAARQNSTRLLFVSQFCGTMRLVLRVSIAKDFLGCVSKIRKAHFRRLNLHILVEKPRPAPLRLRFSPQSASRSSKTASSRL
jgi:hypothetical protein